MRSEVENNAKNSSAEKIQDWKNSLKNQTEKTISKMIVNRGINFEKDGFSAVSNETIDTQSIAPKPYHYTGYGNPYNRNENHSPFWLRTLLVPFIILWRFIGHFLRMPSKFKSRF